VAAAKIGKERRRDYECLPKDPHAIAPPDRPVVRILSA